ncbi:MAG: hypothetical protein F6J90_02730 [Moorea sp. SIOASIH]|nr:hypothetical protein [Moorena sp. SIOASIH]
MAQLVKGLGQLGKVIRVVQMSTVVDGVTTWLKDLWLGNQSKLWEKNNGLNCQQSRFIAKCYLNLIQAQFQSRLNVIQCLTLQLLLGLHQFHKHFISERLAALFPQPILFESGRRYLQIFIKLHQLSVALLWFPNNNLYCVP